MRNLIYCQVNLFKQYRCYLHSCFCMCEIISLIVLICSPIEQIQRYLLSIVEGKPQNSTLGELFAPEEGRLAKNPMKFVHFYQELCEYPPFQPWIQHFPWCSVRKISSNQNFMPFVPFYVFRKSQNLSLSSLFL